MITKNVFVYALFIFIVFSFEGNCQKKSKQIVDSSQVSSRNAVQPELIDSIEVKTIYFDDKSKSQTQYQNGVRNGWTKYIDANGNITSEGTYVNNKMEGEFRVYYPDGKIMMKAFYKSGLLNDITYTYFPHGKVQKETKYERNKIIFIREYDKNGNLLYEDKF